MARAGCPVSARAGAAGTAPTPRTSRPRTTAPSGGTCSATARASAARRTRASGRPRSGRPWCVPATPCWARRSARAPASRPTGGSRRGRSGRAAGRAATRQAPTPTSSAARRCAVGGAGVGGAGGRCGRWQVASCAASPVAICAPWLHSRCPCSLPRLHSPCPCALRLHSQARGVWRVALDALWATDKTVRDALAAAGAEPRAAAGGSAALDLARGVEVRAVVGEHSRGAALLPSTRNLLASPAPCVARPA